MVAFVVPGFVFVEVRDWSRPTRTLSTFDKTVLTILVSTVLHIVFVFVVLLVLHLRGFDLTLIVDQGYMIDRAKEHPLHAYGCAFAYFVATLLFAWLLGWLAGKVEWTVTPVFSRALRRDRPNAVLAQMKNGDFYTGILGIIPGDYDVLQGPAKDFFTPRQIQAEGPRLAESSSRRNRSVEHDECRCFAHHGRGCARSHRNPERAPAGTPKRPGIRKKRA